MYHFSFILCIFNIADNNKSEDEYVYQDTESEVKSDSITVRTCEDIFKGVLHIIAEIEELPISININNCSISDYSLMALPTTLSSEIQQTIVELNTTPSEKSPSEKSLKEVQSIVQNEPDLPNYNVTTNIVNKSVTKLNEGVKPRRTLKRKHKNKSNLLHLKVKPIKKRKHRAFRKVRHNNKSNDVGKPKIANHNFDSRNDILTSISLQCSSNNLITGDECTQNYSVVSKPMWINSNILCTASVAKPVSFILKLYLL